MILANRGDDARAIVGALGALADVGLGSDASESARFEEDLRPRVRAEARRTTKLLRGAT